MKPEHRCKVCLLISGCHRVWERLETVSGGVCEVRTLHETRAGAVKLTWSL